MQLQKNQRISLQITGMTAEGSGVGRVPSDGVESQGLAVFVPYTAVGDEIECRIVKVMSNRAYGITETLLSASPDRLTDMEQ